MSDNKPKPHSEEAKRIAVDKVARDLAGCGMSSETAHREAAKIARESDAKQRESKR